MNLGTTVHSVQLGIALVRIAEMIVVGHSVLNFIGRMIIMLVRQFIGVSKSSANQ